MVVKRKLKSFFIALLSLRHKVTINRHRGRALIAGLGRRLAFFFRIGYDVRMNRSGEYYFQLRDRRAEKKRVKRIAHAIGLSIKKG
jgi:hypothetical protein